jgi:hypothetical protein
VSFKTRVMAQPLVWRNAETGRATVSSTWEAGEGTVKDCLDFKLKAKVTYKETWVDEGSSTGLR